MEKIKEKKDRLIAEFMGFTYETGISLGGSWSRFFKLGGEFKDSFPKAKYHESWDWLMPVGKKCFDICQNQERPNVNACNNLDWLECQISCHIREYNLEQAYEAIVTFITAYNSQSV